MDYGEIYRAPMNIFTDIEAVWMAVPAHIIKAPVNTVGRRPIPSDKYGAKGYAERLPMFYKQVKITQEIRKKQCVLEWRSVSQACHQLGG